jgi:hypothetical protein
MGNSETRGFDSARPENLVRHLVALEDRVRKLEQALNIRPNGNITLKAPGALRLEANAGVEITSNTGIKLFDMYGNVIEFKAAGLDVTASAKLTLAGAMAETNAGTATVNAGMTRCSGVLQCDTLIANNVVGASYTPGAGNLY